MRSKNNRPWVQPQGTRSEGSHGGKSHKSPVWVSAVCYGRLSVTGIRRLLARLGEVDHGCRQARLGVKTDTKQTDPRQPTGTEPDSFLGVCGAVSGWVLSEQPS